jgi:lysophospholipase L1-like esterase
MRVRAVISLVLGLLAAVGFAVSAAGAPVLPGHGGGFGGRGHGGPQRVYLALGDSLAFGYQQAKFEHLFPNEDPAAFDTGYVDDFAHALQMRDPRLEVVNDGCPGETTDSFIEGPCQYQLSFPLHHPYSGGPSSSQLSDALAVLAAHRQFVNPITIDIGANDALHVVGECLQQPACVAERAPALLAHVAANLALILSDLRKAAPRAKIVVLGLYNPLGPQIPGSDQLTEKLNEAMAQDAAAVGARFANPLPVFNPPGEAEQPTLCLLTNICAEPKDIHPTDTGYTVLGGMILEQFLAAPPFGPPWFGRALAGRA